MLGTLTDSTNTIRTKDTVQKVGFLHRKPMFIKYKEALDKFGKPIAN